jgi:hypothetical protein
VGFGAVEGLAAGEADVLAWFVDSEVGADLLQPMLTVKTTPARNARLRALHMEDEYQRLKASLLFCL